MKAGWTEAALGEVATIERSSLQPHQIRDGETYVGLENITSDGEFSEVRTVSADELKSSKFAFDSSHVLFGKLRPYLSKIARPAFSGVCSTDILPVRAGSHLDRDYLFRFLRTPGVIGLATDRSTGANLPRLSPKALAEFVLPLPPLDEQRRIAAVLETADALRDKRRRSLSKVGNLAEAIFIDMFGDPVRNPRNWRNDRTLDDIAEVRSGITVGRKSAESNLTTIPYLAVVNVQDGHLVLDPLKTIEATSTEIDRYRLQDGDIVLTEGGDPDKLGRGAVWRAEVDPCIHQNHVFRVRMTCPDMTAEFVSRLLGSARGKRYFLRMAKQTTGIASINMTQLRSFPLLEPPLSLQRAWLARMEQVQDVEARHHLSAEHLDALFGSLQQRAFRGEL